MPPKATNNAAKKRKRSKGPLEDSAPVASTSTLPPPPAPVTAPAPPPMSAVAARRAAAMLPRTHSSVEDAIVSEEGEDDEDSDQDEELLSLNSSSEEESDASAKAAQKKKKKKLKKVKGRVPGAGRYFGGGADGEVERILPGGESMEVDAGAVFGEQPSAEDTDRRSNGQGKMGRGKRQRRERSAFTDPICLSTFTPSLDLNVHALRWQANGSEVSGYLFCLQAGETLVVHGAYSIAPIFGSLSLLGAIVSSPPTPPTLSLPLDATSTYPVFAPSSHPLPPLEALQSPLGSSGTLKLPSEKEIDLADFSAIVLVSDLVSGIEGVETTLKNGGLGCGNKMWDAGSSSPIAGSTWKLILEPTPSLTLLRPVESWWTSLKRFDPLSTAEGEENGVDDTGRLVVMAEGPKRVGKSTFAKLLLNRLLSKYEKVAYLDTDLGQPEFTTPGLVSLNVLSQPVFGPSFTHLSIPVSAHFLGATSPSSSPSSYLAAVNSLLSLYSLEVEYPVDHDSNGISTSGKITSQIPLVVNTQGWVKGLGADLLSKLKMDARPTHLYSFAASPSSYEENGNSESNEQFDWQDGMNGGMEDMDLIYTRMESAPSSPLDAKWSAADLRTLAFISYFNSSFSSPSPNPSRSTNLLPSSWDFSRPLVAKAPFALNWTEHIQSVHILDNDLPYSQVLRALNGMVVGVVVDTELDSSLEDRPNEARPNFPYSPNALPPSPTSTRSLGLAIIRSIDSTNQHLYLLSPLGTAPLPELKKIRLVKGQIEIPLSLMVDGEEGEGVCGVEWKDVPYLTVVEGEGGRKKVRRNLMRRSQA